MQMAKRMVFAAMIYGLVAATAHAAQTCDKCAGWNVPHQPFKIYGNTYFVGTSGLASVLITSAQGHVLIDGDLKESVPQIVANIRALGFRVEDVKLILNSHVHFDHAGGIAQLQRMTGAVVKASPISAPVLATGEIGRSDPQAATGSRMDPVANVTTVEDGETLRVGEIAIKAVLTPGHTPGGTSWTWESCENNRCLHLVYADSLSPVSSPRFRFTDSPEYPNVVADFEKSFAALETIPCDIIISVHPEFSNF
jgi:metallo-beta-lactamase class B